LPLNDTEILVMQTMIMKLNEPESLAWIRTHQTHKKKPIEVRTFYRIKGKLRSTTEKRKFELQKQGLWEQHLERIDQLETVMRFSWENYHREQEPTKRQKILDSIVAIQPLLSTYYAASQEVIEHDNNKEIQSAGHLSNIPN
tara:strand:- start:4258 stop:4683 length:426 start_codon:yes stop_codon:yes gene_type:complete